MQWALVFVLLVVPYLFTAAYSLREVSVDTITAAMPAYMLARDGSVDISSAEYVIERAPVAMGQTVQVGAARYSNRAPGVSAAAVPFYAMQALVDPDIPFNMAPAGAAAAIVTAAAAATLSLVFRKQAAPTTAVVGAAIVGLGTPTWSVSANSLWAHGPAQLWLAAGMAATASAAYARSGLAYGAALLTRPYTGVVAATVGLYVSARQRRFGPAIKIGLASMVGLALYLAYTRMLFGGASVYGGYAADGTSYHATNLRHMPVATFLSDLLQAFTEPRRGILHHTLWLVPLAFGIPRAWKVAPDWVRALALSGIAYLILQVRANGYGGGDGFYGYRYQLEALWVATPLLLLAWREWVAESRVRQLVFSFLVGFTIWAQYIASSTELVN